MHLVIPERQIFSRDAQSPSASVVLQDTRGDGPRPGGRHPASGGRSRRGSLIARPRRHRRRSRQSSGRRRRKNRRRRRPADSQENQTTEFEDRLRQRVEIIVPSVVGPGPCPRPGRRRHELQPYVNETQRNLRSRQQGRALDADRRAERERHQRQRTTAPFRCRTRCPARPAGEPGNGTQTKSNCDRTEETTNYEISKTVTTRAVGWRRPSRSCRSRSWSTATPRRTPRQGLQAAHRRRR